MSTENYTLHRSFLLKKNQKRIKSKRQNPHKNVHGQTDFNHVTAMFDVWEYSSQRHVYISDAVRYVTGYDPEDYVGKGLDFIISRLHPDDRKLTVAKSEKARKAVEQYRPGMDDTKPYISLDYRLKHKNGHYIWLHSDSCVYSRTPDGKIKYVITTSVNIDAQKAYEAKLKDLASQLEESQGRLQEKYERLRTLETAKDEFVSIASHQLRTPATGVKQYIGLLLQNYVGQITDEQRQVLLAANEFNDRQIKIIEDILNVARVDAGKVQLHTTSTDLTSIVADVVKEQDFKGRARNQEVVTSSGDNAMYTVRADAFLVRMVLENLIENARKYSPEGSLVEARISANNSTVSVEVEDHGFGIAKQDQDKLFKKFSRIQNDKTARIPGTGLGLYWAKQIIDLHGGDLKLVRSSWTGSTFSFSLPVG